MADIEVKDIRNIFSQSNLLIVDLDINEDLNLANVYIEVSSTLIYTIYNVETIIKKIKDIRTILVENDLIEDMRFGDLYQGNWRIIINFKQ